MSLPQAMAQAKAEAKGGKATTNTGGRVVSLTDGREYAIAGTSLVFGRDASCDVVVSGKDVSRRHAEIVQTPKGYLLVDSSTNGTSVNDARIEGQRLLARADVITIGEEKFRFYADAAPPPAPGQVGPAASAPAAVPPIPPTQGSPAAAQRLKETVHGVPNAPPPGPPRPPGPPAPSRYLGAALANFLVKSGALKGQRLVVKTPVVNIGRADYNDFIFPDESVSTTHAKLQRREGVWVLVDLDSSNGTFVDGERIKGEAPLAPGATVRLGDVQLLFEPTDEKQGVAKGGGTQVLRTPHSSALPGPPAPPASPARSVPPAPAAPAAPVRPPPAPGSQPPPPARPGRKPAPRRPVGQQPPPPKKGKGCGPTAAVLATGGPTVVVLLYRLLA